MFSTDNDICDLAYGGLHKNVPCFIKYFVWQGKRRNATGVCDYVVVSLPDNWKQLQYTNPIPLALPVASGTKNQLGNGFDWKPVRFQANITTIS